MPTPRDPESVATLARGLSSATLFEAAGKVGALPSSIKPLSEKFVLAGPAFPLSGMGGDNLYLHHAVYAAEPGSVLVAQVGEGSDFGHWGDVLTAAAQLRGIAGLVITGGVRDSRQIIDMGFPVFAGGVSIRGTGKNPAGAGSIGEPITLGNVTICKGDLIVGDADGLVALSEKSARSIIEKARARDADEDSILQRLRSGQTTLEIYGLPDLLPERPALPARRRSVTVPGLEHGKLPLTNVCRVGSMVATGGIRGVDPATGLMPNDPAGQVQLMYKNLALTLNSIGASLDDVVKVTIWIARPEVRETLNKPWVEMFTDPGSYPARHVLNADLAGGMLVQCEAIAVLSKH